MLNIAKHHGENGRRYYGGDVPHAASNISRANLFATKHDPRPKPRVYGREQKLPPIGTKENEL